MQRADDSAAGRRRSRTPLVGAAVQAALLASVPALIAIPWKPHTSQAHTHALLSDIARAMGASPNKL